MRKRLKQEMINNFQNPHYGVDGHSTDCCPCVFSFLGMPSEYVSYYQKKYGTGFSDKALVEVMNFGFPDYINTFDEVNIQDYLNKDGSLENILDELYGQIPYGFASIGGIRRLYNTAHCISYAKDLYGNIYLFDVQASKWYINDDIKVYLYNNSVKDILLLSSKDKQNGTQLLLDENGNPVNVGPGGRQITLDNLKQANIADTKAPPPRTY